MNNIKLFYIVIHSYITTLANIFDSHIYYFKNHMKEFDWMIVSNSFTLHQKLSVALIHLYFV